MFNQKRIVTVVDFGTSKISVAMAEFTDEEECIVLSVASCASSGAILKGEAIDIQETVSILQDVLTMAEEASMEEIVPESTYVLVTAADIQFTIGEGELFIDNSNGGVITTDDIVEISKRIHQGHIPNNHVSINSFASYYELNDKHIVSNPEGHSASKMKAFSHIVHGDSDKLQNVGYILQEVGLEDYSSFIFAPIASALGTLSELELEKGCAVIDIGAGTTEYVLMYKKGVLCSGVITVGMDHVVNDLASGLDIHKDVAKQIIMDGSYQEKRNSNEAVLAVPHAATTRNLPMVSIEKIIQLRLHELFEIIQKELLRHNIKVEDYSGIVLTGGGTLFQQVNEVAKEVFSVPVRLGTPVNFITDNCQFSPKQVAPIDLNSPRYSALLGGVRYGARTELEKRAPEGSSVTQKMGDFVEETVDSVVNGVKNLWEALKL